MKSNTAFTTTKPKNHKKLACEERWVVSKCLKCTHVEALRERFSDAGSISAIEVITIE